jgi:hypothetical protein
MTVDGSHAGTGATREGEAPAEPVPLERRC